MAGIVNHSHNAADKKYPATLQGTDFAVKNNPAFSTHKRAGSRR